ncbi:MAG: hypothetical protein GWP19_08120 [Planctomycetia bacterium]|nr:hypothetical protein [Planctomycetia bacterium]
MKILYELKITEETGFSADDFPDHFEILRKGKTPLVFKPVALSIQDIYSRLIEAEALLKQSLDLPDGLSARAKHARNIDEYFERHEQ